MTNSVEIDEDGNGEYAEIVVCARLTQPLLLPDNLIDICSGCGEAIQHRPHVPKRPRKMCMECVGPRAAKAAKRGELHTVLTPEIVAELAAHIRKKSAN
jgi:hypothetical protein